LPPVLSALLAIDELGDCREVSALLRLAVELGRTRLGLERVGLFMRDRASDRMLMRGTWGTGPRGETTDERGLYHQLAPDGYQALLRARQSGGSGLYLPHSPLFALDAGRSVLLGQGWVMATPLVVRCELVGVMYNDTALTRSPVDHGKQAALSIFCTVIALLYGAGRGGIGWGPLPRTSGHGPLVDRVLRALDEDLSQTGDRLAADCRVSAGYLARTFKREMGLSLVEYRNRLRLERFFEFIQRQEGGGTLLYAALEAGFGSYAQFHRVYCRCVGSAPSETLSLGGSAAANEGRLGLGDGFRRSNGGSNGLAQAFTESRRRNP
jgi:AraC-like DNA-binding protein